MALNASSLLTPFIQFITGKIIEAGTSMNPAKLVARATELLAINTALTQINGGNTAGLPALQAAITSNTSLDLGEGLALQSLFTALAQQVSLLTNVAGSTLIGQAATEIMNSILTTASSVAQSYITKYTAPAAAQSAAAA